MKASNILDNMCLEKEAAQISGIQRQHSFHSAPMTPEQRYDRLDAGSKNHFNRRFANPRPQPQPQPQPQQNKMNWVEHEQKMYNKALEEQTGVPVWKPSGEKPDYKLMADAGSIEGPTKRSRGQKNINKDIQSQLDNQQPAQVANQNSNPQGLLNRGTSWVKNNPGKAALGATAIAGAAAAAYGIHKHNQKKKEEEQKRQSAYSQPMYHTASTYLDELVMEKQAASEVEDFATQIPEQIIPDEASMMERIVESVKYNKPQRTPGGKATPSKFVQRKNKERFRK